MKDNESLPEIFVAVDVEADGPIPGPYSMLSLGMAVVGHPDLNFYTELKPISDQYVDRAVDTLFRKFRDRGRATPGNPDAAQAVHEGPIDQSWGTREWYVDDPHGNTLRFTQGFLLPPVSRVVPNQSLPLTCGARRLSLAFRSPSLAGR